MSAASRYLVCISMGLGCFAPLASYAAALKCESVLLSPSEVSSNHQKEALDSLARLKFSLDSKLAGEGLNTADKILQVKLKQKFQEVLISFKGQLNEQQLRALVIERIQKIQGKSTKEAAEEIAARVEMDKLAPYSQIDGFSTEAYDIFGFQFTSENQKSIYYRNWSAGDFAIFNIEKREQKKFPTRSSIILKNDRVLFVDENKRAQLYDIATENLTPLEIPQIQKVQWLEISKSKNWAAAYNGDQISIFNPSTGQVSSASFSKPTRLFGGLFAPPLEPYIINDAHFLNDSEILVKVARTYYKFNFQTGQKVKLKGNFFKSGIRGFEISPDEKHVLISNNESTVRYLEIKDIEDIDKKSRHMSKILRGPFTAFHFLEDGKTIYVQTENDRSYATHFWDLETLNEVTPHADLQFDKMQPATQPIQAKDGAIYVIRWSGSDRANMLETWGKKWNINKGDRIIAP